MSKILLRQGLAQSNLSQEEMFSNEGRSVSLESVMGFFRRKKAMDKRTEKKVYTLEYFDELVEQLYNELDEFIGVDQFPEDLVEYDDDYFHQQMDIAGRSLSFWNYLRYCIAGNVGSWCIQTFMLEIDVDQLVEDLDKYKDGDVVHQTDLLTFTAGTINRDRHLFVNFDFRLSREDPPRNLQSAIEEVTETLEEQFQKIYDEHITKDDNTSFLVDWNEVEDIQDPRETFRDLSEFQFGFDNGAGDYTAIVTVDDEPVVIEWDHESSKIYVE